MSITFVWALTVTLYITDTIQTNTTGHDSQYDTIHSDDDIDLFADMPSLIYNETNNDDEEQDIVINPTSWPTSFPSNPTQKATKTSKRSKKQKASHKLSQKQENELLNTAINAAKLHKQENLGKVKVHYVKHSAMEEFELELLCNQKNDLIIIPGYSYLIADKTFMPHLNNTRVKTSHSPMDFAYQATLSMLFVLPDASRSPVQNAMNTFNWMNNLMTMFNLSTETKTIFKDCMTVIMKINETEITPKIKVFFDFMVDAFIYNKQANISSNVLLDKDVQCVIINLFSLCLISTFNANLRSAAELVRSNKMLFGAGKDWVYGFEKLKSRFYQRLDVTVLSLVYLKEYDNSVVYENLRDFVKIAEYTALYWNELRVAEMIYEWKFIDGVKGKDIYVILFDAEFFDTAITVLELVLTDESNRNNRKQMVFERYYVDTKRSVQRNERIHKRPQHKRKCK